MEWFYRFITHPSRYKRQVVYWQFLCAYYGAVSYTHLDVYKRQGNIGSKLMGFFMLPFYTNWLSPADYGTTDLLIVYANLLLNVVAVSYTHLYGRCTSLNEPSVR